MKILLIALNTALIAYFVHLYVNFDPMRAAIERTILEVVAFG